MFVIALASLVFGYALLYYAVDAMMHYDAGAKTTKGIPFGVALGIPSNSNAADTAMVFAKWGSGGGAPQTSGASSPAPGAAGSGPVVAV
jgi:hypothetical protein